MGVVVMSVVVMSVVVMSVVVMSVVVMSVVVIGVVVIGVVVMSVVVMSVVVIGVVVMGSRGCPAAGRPTRPRSPAGSPRRRAVMARSPRPPRRASGPPSPDRPWRPCEPSAAPWPGHRAATGWRRYLQSVPGAVAMSSGDRARSPFGASSQPRPARSSLSTRRSPPHGPRRARREPGHSRREWPESSAATPPRRASAPSGVPRPATVTAERVRHRCRGNERGPDAVASEPRSCAHPPRGHAVCGRAPSASRSASHAATFDAR